MTSSSSPTRLSSADDGRPWDAFVTPLDREVFAAGGYGARGGLGRRPALLVIDVTIGFCGEVCEPILDSIRTWRSSSGERAWAALPQIERLLAAARRASAPVFYTHGVSRRPDGADRGRWADKNRRQDADTDRRHEFLPRIAPAPDDWVVAKEKPSAFFGTPLVGRMLSLGIDSVILCGTSTSGCVRATAVDAFSYDLKVAVVEDATFDRGQASHAMTLFDLDMKYADVVGTAEVETHLAGLAVDDPTHGSG